MNMGSIKVMNQDPIKLDQFDDNNFTCWQDKITYLFTILGLSYILSLDLASLVELKEDDSKDKEGLCKT